MGGQKVQSGRSQVLWKDHRRTKDGKPVVLKVDEDDGMDRWRGGGRERIGKEGGGGGGEGGGKAHTPNSLFCCDKAHCSTASVGRRVLIGGEGFPFVWLFHALLFLSKEMSVDCISGRCRSQQHTKS